MNDDARYITEPDDAAVFGCAWHRLSPTVEITRVPLVDTLTGLWARLTYRDALAVAARLGGRLPTRGEVGLYIEQAKKAGTCLRPVMLSHGPEMVTLGHAKEHDRLVAEQLAALDEEKQRRGPIGGIGKHWVSGARNGWSRICGWWNGLRLIQLGLKDIHLNTHHDYATTTLVVREVAA